MNENLCVTAATLNWTLAVLSDESKLMGGEHQRRNQRPLPRIARVTCIPKVVPAILRAGDFSPGYLDLIRSPQPHES